jgi:hypothetical protein
VIEIAGVPDGEDSVTDIKVFFLIYQLMHKRIALKRKSKFTIKPLRHVSVQSPSSGSALFVLTKVTVVKVVN